MFPRKSFFNKEETEAIVKAITEAEAMTSGEIRVHVEAACEKEVLERATEVFYTLGMDKTEHANGVLIYIAHKDKKLAIIGDKGINAVVPANFWEGTKEAMREHFKQNDFFKGVVFAIHETGSHLKQYFPHYTGQKNELSDEISEG